MFQISTKNKSVPTSLGGSLIIFTCGVVGLSFFVPSSDLLMAGVLPFLPGDLLKTLLASSIAFQC